jgi:hypothetical protein
MDRQAKERFWRDVEKNISKERLSAYRLSPTEPPEDTFARYLWNVTLCEALYPSLQFLEICLRNNIHTAASNHFKNSWWFEQSLPTNQRLQEEIDKARNSLQKDRKPVTPGGIIAQLSFGFWTTLFQSAYENVLWRKIIKQTFPQMPKKIRTRKNLKTTLESIRRTRNRVSHHEPIWKDSKLKQHHEEIVRLISWMSAPAATCLQEMDRFDEIFSQGLTPHQNRLSKILN